MSNHYYQELNWSLDISHTGSTLKQWCTEENGNYRFFQIPIERICDEFEVYRNFRDVLKQHDMILYRCKFMQMNPGDFMKIHIDQSIRRVDASADALHYYDESNAMKYADIATPVEVSLNVPIMNADDHITRWYDPKNRKVDLRVAPCGPLPSLDLKDFPNAEALVQEHCVASFRMTKPTLIRTNELHNVDARSSNKTRWIMSFRINDKHTGSFLKWSDLGRVHNIKL
jgi:hypothetical protein